MNAQNIKKIEFAISAARAVDEALPSRKSCGIKPVDDAMRGVIYTAARDAAWREAAVHVFEALTTDSALDFAEAMVPVSENSALQDEAPLYEAHRLSDAVTWIRAQPAGTHKRIALAIANECGVD